MLSILFIKLDYKTGLHLGSTTIFACLSSILSVTKSWSVFASGSNLSQQAVIYRTLHA